MGVWVWYGCSGPFFHRVVCSSCWMRAQRFERVNGLFMACLKHAYNGRDMFRNHETCTCVLRLVAVYTQSTQQTESEIGCIPTYTAFASTNWWDENSAWGEFLCTGFSKYPSDYVTLSCRFLWCRSLWRGKKCRCRPFSSSARFSFH